jgi:uncharacterized protein (DUF1778 family)
MAKARRYNYKKKAAPAKALKDEVIRMRVSAEQKWVLREAAARDGLELSAWLRQGALRAAGALPPPE